MTTLKNFVKYIPNPEIEQEKEAAEMYNQIGGNALFLKDENGNDWYLSQKLFSKDTVKFAYDKKGVLKQINKDVSAIVPVDLSVSELAESDFPEEADQFGRWGFFDGKIEYIAPTTKELVAEAEYKKTILLEEASKIIAPLQDAVDLDMATDEEKTKLLEWKKYRIYLNRVDTSTAPDITWPEKPSS